MAHIGTKKRTFEILDRHGLSANKRFGQNFLIDTNILKKIVERSDINKDTLVIEVGPGLGALTEHLIASAGQVVCVEIDKNMIPILNENLGHNDNFELVHNDILKVDIESLINKYDYKDVAVVANLPYYITTPILMRFLEGGFPINRLSLMMQKEVAQRLSAKIGTKEYNALSIIVQYHTNAQIVINVSKNVFHPVPQVDSAVVRLDKRDQPLVCVDDEKHFFEFLHNCFKMRRKTLVNNLRQSYPSFTLEELTKMLESLGIDSKVRADNLSVYQFADIYKLIS